MFWKTAALRAHDITADRDRRGPVVQFDALQERATARSTGQHGVPGGDRVRLVDQNTRRWF